MAFDLPPGTGTVTDIETSYARLLAVGVSDGPSLDTDSLPGERIEVWTRTFAERFFELMRERAWADGLRIEGVVALRWARPLPAGGRGTLVARVAIVRPDGGLYDPDWKHRHGALAEVEADWGGTLRAARARRGVPPPLDYDSSYAKLLRRGFWNGPMIQSWPSEDVVVAWERDVAEPWLQAMRERAAGDGLQVTAYLSTDGTLMSVGVDNVAPFVAIISPDGTRYDPHWRDPAAALRAIEHDWGETLAAARRRHPDVDRPREG